MILLRDEFEFLLQLARNGGRAPVPENSRQELIVQILVSYRLLCLENDQLRLTDRGRTFLVLGRRLKRGIVESLETATTRYFV